MTALDQHESVTDRDAVIGDGLGAELVDRARRLAPVSIEHARRADEERHLPAEMVDAFAESGLIRTLVPERWGGYGLGLSEAIDVIIEVAKPSGSMGWVASLWIDHPHWLGFFPEAAQADVWGESPDLRISTSFPPLGQVEPVPGGWRLSGRWTWASGAAAARWLILGALVRTGDSPDHRLFLVPAEDAQILDTWYSAGLRGSGSDDVVVEEAFVPEHRTLRMAEVREGDTPGGRVNLHPIFQAPLVAHGGWAMLSPGIGVARGMVEAWVERARGKAHSYTKQQLAESLPMQLRLAESDALIDTAETLLDACIVKVESGEPFTQEERLRARRDMGFAGTLLVKAVGGLMQMGGAGALREESPIQRGWRDMQAMASHAVLNFPAAGEQYGRLRMGAPLDPRDPFF